MTKFMINSRTDAWKTNVNFFFTITNCPIVRSRPLPHRINYKLMSVRLLTIKISQWARGNFCSYLKINSRMLWTLRVQLQIEVDILEIPQNSKWNLVWKVVKPLVTGLTPKVSWQDAREFPLGHQYVFFLYTTKFKRSRPQLPTYRLF